MPTPTEGTATMITTTTTTTEGTYLVGLPVIVFIAADGTISLDVCAEDLCEAIGEEGATPEQIAAASRFLTNGTQIPMAHR